MNDETHEGGSLLQLAAIVQESHDAIIGETLDGLIMSWNGGATKMFGYTAQEVIGKPASILLPSEMKDETSTLMKKVGNDEVIADYDSVRLLKNGSRINVSLSVSPIHDEKGKIVGASVVERDITERKKGEDKTKQAAAELVIANKELAFQNREKEKRADELVVANEELTYQNKEKEKKAAELIIANKELAHEDEEKEKRAAELVIANKELALQNREKEKRSDELFIANKELAFQNEEKEKRAAELVIANKELAFQNVEKEKRAAELVIANKELALENREKEKRAAELVVANKELAFQNEEKEKRAAELVIANNELAFQNEEKEKRAAELVIANKELAFQNEEKEKRVEELKQLDKLKDSFLFTTTHELKTPLVPIKAQAQLLMSGSYGKLNAEQENAMRMILRNVDNLSRLSGDILDFARIKSGALTIRAEEASLADVIIDAVEDMEVLAKERNVTLTLSPLPELPQMVIDKGRIKQVLNNLLDNALKFTQEKGSIVVEAKKMIDAVKITVTDSGIGITKDNLGKLFTPFFQIDSNLNRKYKGTGLGLVVSKGIIEAHDGTLEAESAGENKGSAFIVTLPFEKKSSEAHTV